MLLLKLMMYIVSVFEHKTGVGGAARLMLNESLYDDIKKYIKLIRPCIEPEDEFNENVFLLPNGKKVMKLSNLIRFMESELNITIPSATEVRKIGATAVAKKCTEGEARVVARQMAHDPRVSAQYYQAVRGVKDAKKAYDTLKEVVSKKTPSKKWDDESTEILRIRFEKNIKDNKTPKMSECGGIIKGKDPKQVQDKIRTIIRQKNRKK